jgi:acetyl-CoA acetyltransferase
MAGVGPEAVDVALLYDHFTPMVIMQLEDYGFCKVGEGGPFVEDGTRIARDGELPLNTNGGQLSGGRLHGYGFLHEAATQMWGEGGDRQVAGPPEVVAVAAGGGHTCGCLLLVRD